MTVSVQCPGSLLRGGLLRGGLLRGAFLRGGLLRGGLLRGGLWSLYEEIRRLFQHPNVPTPQSCHDEIYTVAGLRDGTPIRHF